MSHTNFLSEYTYQTHSYQALRKQEYMIRFWKSTYLQFLKNFRKLTYVQVITLRTHFTMNNFRPVGFFDILVPSVTSSHTLEHLLYKQEILVQQKDFIRDKDLGKPFHIEGTRLHYKEHWSSGRAARGRGRWGRSIREDSSFLRVSISVFALADDYTLEVEAAVARRRRRSLWSSSMTKPISSVQSCWR